MSNRYIVNKGIARLLGVFAGPVGDWMPNGVKARDGYEPWHTEVDYTKNWDDLMPLLEDYEVSIFPIVEGKTLVRLDGFELVVNTTDRKIALTYCLLRVLQNKAEDESDG